MRWERVKDDSELDDRVVAGNPAIPRICAVGPEALRRRLSTVLPMEALREQRFRTERIQLSAVIMLLQLSVVDDSAR